MEQVVESFVSVQRQINSLASVALQNRQALDILTTKKGRTCLFLGEDCCYFVNKIGIVQGRVKELRDKIECCRKELQNLYGPQNLFQQVLPWLLPFQGPLLLIILSLLFGPCLFNLFQRFLQEWIRAISRSGQDHSSSQEPHPRLRKKETLGPRTILHSRPKTVAPYSRK